MISLCVSKKTGIRIGDDRGKAKRLQYVVDFLRNNISLCPIKEDNLPFQKMNPEDLAFACATVKIKKAFKNENRFLKHIPNSIDDLDPCVYKRKGQFHESLSIWKKKIEQIRSIEHITNTIHSTRQQKLSHNVKGKFLAEHFQCKKTFVMKEHDLRIFSGDHFEEIPLEDPSYHEAFFNRSENKYSANFIERASHFYHKTKGSMSNFNEDGKTYFE
jgi:hypothetical protein